MITVIITSEDSDWYITRREEHATFFDEVDGSGWFGNFTCNLTGIRNTIFLNIHNPLNWRTCCLVSDSTSFESIVEPLHTSWIVRCIEGIAADIITGFEIRCTDRFRRWRNNKGLRRCTVGANTSCCLTETVGTVSVSDFYGTFNGSIDGCKLVGI